MNTMYEHNLATRNGVKMHQYVVTDSEVNQEVTAGFAPEFFLIASPFFFGYPFKFSISTLIRDKQMSESFTNIQERSSR